MCRFVFITILAVVFCFGGAGFAMDAAAHFDCTRDAMTAEGFGNTAIQVAQVTNWMVDFYEQASRNPYSGHSAWWKELIGGAIGWREHWPDGLVNDADWLHFDSTATFTGADGAEHHLDSTIYVTKEWNRLARATREAAIGRARAGDYMGLLAVIGISCHAVQDFYVHTNWVEPRGTPVVDGHQGPGWTARGEYGSHPTWFDVPVAARTDADVYGCVGGSRRGHGYWNSDGNTNLKTAMNKDWPGRPFYKEAYITSYFATRQWIRAIRQWLANDAAWRAAQTYNDTKGGKLSIDLNLGALGVQFNAGHWQGQGEPTGADAPGPGGSLDDLYVVIGAYHRAGKTPFRQKFEQMVREVAKKAPAEADTPVESSALMQAATEFICVKVNYARDATPTGAIGIDPGLDQADFYAKSTIAGQDFMSGMIHGYDTFDFRLPNYPFTFIKAIPKTWQCDDPVLNMQVSVRTGDVQWGGTDDDVYLRVNDTTRFKLDKPLYNDFERGDYDTYSIAPPKGMKVGDIKYVQIEKSPDGAAGGWRLSRVKLVVNGNEVYYKDRIDTWLEDDHRAWRAPDFRPRNPTTTEVPISITLMDSDGGLYGDDDLCDVNPDFNRFGLNLLYNRNTGAFRGDAAGVGGTRTIGGSRYGGRDDDNDRCEMGFAIERYSVTAPAEPRGGIEVTARLTADPVRHTGALPATITFKGSISVNYPCEVRYRFIRSDNGVGPIQTLTFDAPGSKSVQETWKLGKAYNGWEAIKIIEPVAVESNHATFSVTGPVARPAPRILAPPKRPR